MPDFLLEIGCEEIPARMIAAASEELRERVEALLSRERLSSHEVTHFDTPRRLAVMAAGIAASQADVVEQITGPSVNVAYKGGQPTPAAHAFAKKAGVDAAQLEKVTTPKGEYLAAKVTKKGRSAAEILAEGLPKELSTIYWPKNMYWRKPNERFVRPVRWLVAMLDGETISLEFDGIRAGKTSRGHRILTDGAVTIPRAGSAYIDSLRAAKVLGRAEREHQIRKALDAATRTVPGARWREDQALLDTVVNLTEFPSAILGGFDPQFLALPEEVLVTVMRDHQKYFAVEDANGKLAPHFLAVLNTQVDDEGAAIIRHGNARVLTARFKDARFFWDFDQKTLLVDRVESLKSVTFQKELGSYYWKTEANLAVARALSSVVKAAGVPFDEHALLKAVELAKTDLTAELVKEFTELQGIIGGLYARAQGLGERVAIAIYEQYTPASTEDEIPPSIQGQLLGLADRIQTITAMFSVGAAPTGSKDPFALRRAANAIIKILAESGLPLTLAGVVDAGGADDIQKDQVSAFLRERLHFYLKDVRGLAYDVVNAVLAAGADDVRDAIARAAALSAARESADFAAISAAFKRIKNILRQADEKHFEIGSPKDATLAPEAQQLADAAALLTPEV